MKYADTGTTEFRDPDGDSIVLRSEPTGSQYDERAGLLGSMRIPGNLINENADMESLFAGGELVEVNVDKKALAEFQFKALFVSMTVGGRTISSISDAMGIYRKLSVGSKDWIDKQVDEIWKSKEDEIQRLVGKGGAEGESSAPPENSSGDIVSMPSS